VEIDVLNTVGTVRDEDLVAYIRSWFDLIASGGITDACNQLDEPNRAGIVWTPQKIIDVISKALHIKNDSVVITSTSSCSGSPEGRIFRLLNGSGFVVEHQIPLNGQYCEVTAMFEFLWRGKALAFTLDGLHVL
jgi:hypothetical protein